MFDARSILDMLVRGGGQPPGSGPGQGADVFRDLLGQLGGQPGHRAAIPCHRTQGRITPNRSAAQRRAAAIRTIEPDASPPGQTGGGSLEDLLRSVLGGGGQRGTAPQAAATSWPGGGSLEDLLRSVLGGGGQPGQAPDGGAQVVPAAAIFRTCCATCSAAAVRAAP